MIGRPGGRASNIELGCGYLRRAFLPTRCKETKSGSGVRCGVANSSGSARGRASEAGQRLPGATMKDRLKELLTERLRGASYSGYFMIHQHVPSALGASCAVAI